MGHGPALRITELRGLKLPGPPKLSNIAFKKSCTQPCPKVFCWLFVCFSQLNYKVSEGQNFQSIQPLHCNSTQGARGMTKRIKEGLLAEDVGIFFNAFKGMGFLIVFRKGSGMRCSRSHKPDTNIPPVLGLVESNGNAKKYVETVNRIGAYSGWRSRGQIQQSVCLGV